MNISVEQLKKLIMKYDYDNGSYPESDYEGLSVYYFICKELGIECDLEEYDEIAYQKYAKFLKETFEMIEMKVTNLNETLSKEELAKVWAETIYMADRPRTWKEWFCWTFYGKFRIFKRVN